MDDRIVAELALLRKDHSDLEYQPEGRWVRIPLYPLPEGWNRRETDAVFQIPVGFAGTPPYGIYVPQGVLYREARPNNYTEPAPVQPPFGGSWGVFSWTPDESQWRPAADVVTGSNLRGFVRSFADRFQEGV